MFKWKSKLDILVVILNLQVFTGFNQQAKTDLRNQENALSVSGSKYISQFTCSLETKIYPTLYRI